METSSWSPSFGEATEVDEDNVYKENVSIGMDREDGFLEKEDIMEDILGEEKVGDETKLGEEAINKIVVVTTAEVVKKLQETKEGLVVSLSTPLALENVKNWNTNFKSFASDLEVIEDERDLQLYFETTSQILVVDEAFPFSRPTALLKPSNEEDDGNQL
ncbi:hypothetical protein L1987_46883 [Smallanthus sonchifolius]|uniref:Uncharacterized protein n=1 Tax=Smallanthus sonchifolius TaxID=185202 RepID=A0ACB9G0P5_9ASTR|nr:hypothetical protein L1987_46883 [Smallanthus sonchifolius]